MLAQECEKTGTKSLFILGGVLYSVLYNKRFFTRFSRSRIGEKPKGLLRGYSVLLSLFFDLADLWTSTCLMLGVGGGGVRG